MDSSDDNSQTVITKVRFLLEPLEKGDEVMNLFDKDRKTRL